MGCAAGESSVEGFHVGGTVTTVHMTFANGRVTPKGWPGQIAGGGIDGVRLVGANRRTYVMRVEYAEYPEVSPRGGGCVMDQRERNITTWARLRSHRRGEVRCQS